MRRFLQRSNVTVYPNEDLTGAEQRPDFRCAYVGDTFYVEVTCISTTKATEETGLNPEKPGSTNYRPLNDSVFEACRAKAPQCGNLDNPALVAVCTFHGPAAMLSFSKGRVDMLLTGETKITWNIDIQTGSQVGETFQSTDFRSAAFLRPNKQNGFGFARNSISGLLLCGVGFEPPNVVGILHPNPARPFRPQVFPHTAFCEVQIDNASGTLSTTWIGGGDE